MTWWKKWTKSADFLLLDTGHLGASGLHAPLSCGPTLSKILDTDFWQWCWKAGISSSKLSFNFELQPSVTSMKTFRNRPQYMVILAAFLPLPTPIVSCLLVLYLEYVILKFHARKDTHSFPIANSTCSYRISHSLLIYVVYGIESSRFC